MLQVSEKTIYRWIKEKAIPFYHINHQYRFDKGEINDWIFANRVKVPGIISTDKSEIFETQTGKKSPGVRELLVKGGIYYKIEGAESEECIRNSLLLIKFSSEVSKDVIVQRILERERLMHTGMGNGVAFPHARSPVFSRAAEECISLCFLNSPIEYGALDGKPVHSLFFVLTSSLGRHLDCMTKLAFFCRDRAFIHLLETQAARGEIISLIEKRESEWL